MAEESNKSEVVSVTEDNNKATVAIKFTEDQPIKLQTIKKPDGTLIGCMVCMCGNGDQGNFFKYPKITLVKDVKNRFKEVTELHMICGRKQCRKSVSFQTLQKQYQELTKTS